MRRNAGSLAAMALLSVIVSLAALGGPVLALQEEPAPEPAPEAPPPPPPVRVVALGAIEWTSVTPDGQAAGLAIRDDLPRKLAQAAPETVRVMPLEALKRAAQALAPAVDVRDWASSRSAAKQLTCDIIILIEGQTMDQILSARWQLFDTSSGQGTLGAGQLPGHMIDLDGFVTSLTRRIAEAIGGFDPGRLRTDTRVGVSDSNEAYAAYFLGRAELQAGNYAEAAAHLNEALSRDPNLAAARWRLAGATAGLAAELRAGGGHEEAIALAAQALGEIQGTNLDETRATLLETLEASYAALGQTPQAQEAALARAEALLSMGQSRSALVVIDGLLRDGYQHPRIPLAIASALRLSDDGTAAEAVLQDALTADPASAAVAYALGDLRLGLSESLAEAPEAAERRQALAQSALETLQSAAQLSQQSPEVVARLGEAWRVMGNLGEARAALTLALETGAGTLPARIHARALCSLGRIGLAEGQAEEAQARLGEAYALAMGVPLTPMVGAPAEPIDYAPARAWADLGHAFLDLGNPVLAQNCLREGEVRCGPNAAFASLSLRLAAIAPEPPPEEPPPAEAPVPEAPPAEEPPAPEGA